MWRLRLHKCYTCRGFELKGQIGKHLLVAVPLPLAPIGGRGYRFCLVVCSISLPERLLRFGCACFYSLREYCFSFSGTSKASDYIKCKKIKGILRRRCNRHKTLVHATPLTVVSHALCARTARTGGRFLSFWNKRNENSMEQDITFDLVAVFGSLLHKREHTYKDDFSVPCVGEQLCSCVKYTKAKPIGRV